MADDGTVSIKIAGEVDASLTSSTAAAKSSLADLATAGNAAADALDGGLKEGFLNSALAAARMAGEVAGLGEKLSSADFIGAASDIAGIATSLAELGPALGPAGAIGAIAGGLGYLAYKSLAAQKDVDGLAEGFALTGRGATMGAEAVEYELGFLSQLPGSTSKAAEGFMHLVSQHADWSTVVADSVGQLMPAFIKSYGDDAPQAAGRLVAALSDLTESGFEKLNKEMLGLNPTEFETIQHLIQIGDTAKAASLILADLSRDSGSYIKSLGDKVYDELQKIANIEAEMKGPVGRGEGRTLLVQQLQQERDALAEIRNEEQRDDRTSKNNAYTSQLEAVQKIGQQLDDNTERLQKQMSEAKAFGARAQSRGDSTGVADAAQTEAKIQQKLNEETYKNYVDRQDAMAAAAKTGSAARVASAQNEVKEAKQLFGDQSNQYLQALGKLNAAKRENSEQGSRESAATAKIGAEEEIDSARNAASEIIGNDRLSTAAKLANAQSMWAQLLAGDRLNAQERADVAKEEANEESQIRRQAAKDAEAIGRGLVDTQVELAKIAIEGEKASLELSVGYNQLTAAQKIAIQKAFYDKEVQDQIDALEFDMEGMDESTKAYQDAQNKITILTAQRVQKDNEYAAQEKQAQIAQWDSTVNAIEGAESELVSDIFTKRQSLGADLQQIGLKMLQDEITNDLKMLTRHIFMNQEMALSDKTSAQQGMLWHLLFGQQQTSATVSNAAAQTAAVTAGAQAQVTAQTTAKSEGMAQSIAMGSAQIMNDAYQAAAGTYQAVAQIPYVGWLLAPAAAAGAFAAVAGFDVLTSAAGGQLQVPFDGQLTELHRNEMVLPASIAGRMRDHFAGSPNSGAGGGDTFNMGGLHIAGMDLASIAHNPTFQREATRVMKNMHRNAVRR